MSDLVFNPVPIIGGCGYRGNIEAASADGVVHLRGMLEGPSGGVALILPPALRPKVEQVTLTAKDCFGKRAGVPVTFFADGRVVALAGTDAGVHILLDGLSFPNR